VTTGEEQRPGAVGWLLRHPVLATFLAALALRAAVAIAVSVTRGGTLFLDDRTYVAVAQAAADGRLDRVGFDAHLLYDMTRTLLLPLAVVFRVVGPSNLVGQLYVALLGAATAAFVARLALEVVPRPWALAAGLIAAAVPSQVLWSSLVLKDAGVWCMLAGLAVVAAVAGRTTGRRLLIYAAAAIALLTLLAYLRRHTTEFALVALVIAMAVSIRPQRMVRVAGAVCLLLFLPLAFDMGFAGVPYLGSARDPAVQRSLNAGGTTTVVKPAPPPQEDHVTNEFLYLPKGVSVIAVRPWPWESNPSLGITLARIETVLWYPLLLLALVGVCWAWPRRRALAFPIAVGGAITVSYGLTEGNLGTAYRHRGELVWIVVVLAVLGMERLWAWRTARRRRERTSEGVPTLRAA
jgi:hypothetical protein